MNREEEQVNSPCVNICRIDQSKGYCIGCFRTLEEIASWPNISSGEKKRILRLIESRRGTKRYNK